MSDNIQIIKECKMGRNADRIFSPESGFWADCPVPRVDLENSCFMQFDDFETLSLGDATGIWTIDQTNGSAVLASSEGATGLGGIVKVGTDGSLDNDFAFMKVSSTDTGAPFKITANSGLKLWFAIRMYVSSVSDCSYYIGLFDQTVTEPFADDAGTENMGAAQDGVYFRTVNATPTEIDWCCAKNGTETEVEGAMGTLAATTWITLGFYFNGATEIYPYINGAAQDGDVMSTDLTNCPSGSTDQGFTVGFGVKEGSAGGTATYIYVDWIKCVQERSGT